MKALDKTYAASLCILASVLPFAAAAADKEDGSGGMMRTITIVAVIGCIFLVLAAVWYSVLWLVQRLKRGLGYGLDQPGRTR
jgi:hypothetical protein